METTIDYSVITSEDDLTSFKPFEGMRHRAEKEVMICQTYLACSNFQKSKVAITPKSSMANWISFEYLIQAGWFEAWEEGEQRYCRPTMKCHKEVLKHLSR